MLGRNPLSHAPSNHSRNRAVRRERQPSRHRCPPRLEPLEDRITPSILGTFELDANVTTGVLGTSGSTTTSHDWDQVFADNNVVPPPSSGAIASAFVTDAFNSRSDAIFTGGGSKDTQGIQEGPWLFTDAKPQAKDDITHAYAALYTDSSNGHQILYAGLDRYDNSGDATAGFWFFRNNISESPNVSGNGTGPFVGTHSDGDILLVSDFTIGGSTSTIKVFRWTGDDATGSLVALSDIPNTTFAIVNGGPISVPWSFTNKSGESSPAHGEFLEEGVDLTALGLGGCFSAFLAETRSSQSPTATLSDFVVGNFPVCSLAAPQFAGLSKVGDPATYPLTVQNTGAMPLYIQSVTDTLLGNIVVNHTLQKPGASGVNAYVTAIDAGGFDFSQPLASGASLTIFVTRTVQASDPDPTFNTTTFIGTDDLAGTQDPITATVTNSVNLFQPSAKVTVTTNPTTAQALGDPITYTYTVSNTSSSDSPNLVLDTNNANNSFTDTLLGNLEADAIHAATGNNTATVASLAPGASFSFTETRAIQAGDPNPLTNTTTVKFTLAQNLGTFTNIISASASASVTLLPHLTIVKSVNGPDVIHPGDTASFIITVTDDGAGPATNVVVTDQLPEPDLLDWSASSSTFTTSVSTGDYLTATLSSLAAGASASITVSALVPSNIFGNTSGTPNGDPLPTGLFELDGNTTDDPTVAGDDWSSALGFDTPGMFGSSVARSFVSDPFNSRSDDIFTGGGSKDVLGIQQGSWLFTASKPQAKDDITHAYAAQYTDPSTGDVILYAGLDRYDNSGDATAGFWFFVNPISKNPNVTTNGGHPFVGTHSDGDILLVSDFTIGGSTSTIRVFRWTGNDTTGSLVALNNGNPINGSTFAIVNGTSISVPWSFTNKSNQTQPAAGEFLEEGVNLSALGLNACFSSFLAETRSSQSPTATLSDFVIGQFDTCNLELPNSASVSASNFNNGQPITSNTVTITVNDGHALLADSPGSANVRAGPTAEQLQAAVTQGLDAWRAAGIDPRLLSGLDRIPIRVANLPGTELGFTSSGTIWIDRTAAGWGWSTNGDPTEMDLTTVVTHELGHLLGFDHEATGVMETTLMPGARLVPEALTHSATIAVPGTSAAGSISIGVPTNTAPAVSHPADLGGGPARVPQNSPSRTETLDAVLATVLSGATPVTPQAGTQTLPAVIGAFQDGAGVPRALEGGPLNLGRGTFLLSYGTMDPEDDPTELDQDASGFLVPGLWPPLPRMDGDDGVGGARAAERAAWAGPSADRDIALLDGGGEAQASVGLRQQACDACFADGSWRAVPADGSQSPDAVAASAALAIVLGGSWSAPRAENERRTRQRFLR
jgi:uncharacterized repeat protein (TIGR01451 family)